MCFKAREFQNSKKITDLTTYYQEIDKNELLKLEFDDECSTVKFQTAKVANFCCKICNKTFETNSEAIRHEKEHDKENKYSCLKCKIVYANLAEFTEHKNILHIKPEKWKHICKLCDARYLFFCI